MLTSFHQSELYTTIITWVEAGEIPSFGTVIKDGFLYYNGEEQGRVMALRCVSGNWTVQYLMSEDRIKKEQNEDLRRNSNN